MFAVNLFLSRSRLPVGFVVISDDRIMPHYKEKANELVVMLLVLIYGNLGFRNRFR